MLFVFNASEVPINVNVKVYDRIRSAHAQITLCTSTLQQFRKPFLKMSLAIALANLVLAKARMTTYKTLSALKSPVEVSQISA